MGLLGWFQKTNARPSLPQLCYDIAYTHLPKQVYEDVDQVKQIGIKSGAAGAPFYYHTACKLQNVPPTPEDAQRFRWHHGFWDGGKEYLALEYPSPPPLDLSKLPPDKLLKLLESGSIVQAPYYSVVIRDAASDVTRYFVLGQSNGGGTTLREVTAERNLNLGDGPEPRLSALLEALSERKAWRKDDTSRRL